MNNKDERNIISVVLFVVGIFILLLTGILNFNDNNESSSGENNVLNPELTETDVLQLGRNLYSYAHNVGNCKEFKYLHNQPSGSIVLNYEEVSSHFTDDYINNKTSVEHRNVFRTIEKDTSGNYIDISVCGFGLSCATSSLTDFKIINKTNDYITFEATVSFTSSCGENTGSLVRTETDEFSIKKENNAWKIDYYEFKIITDLLK